METSLEEGTSAASVRTLKVSWFGSFVVCLQVMIIISQSQRVVVPLDDRRKKSLKFTKNQKM